MKREFEEDRKQGRWIDRKRSKAEPEMFGGTRRDGATVYRVRTSLFETSTS